MDFCIVYLSTSDVLGAGQLHESLKKVVYNRSFGITGVLIHCNGSIIQALAGEAEKVNAPYHAIAMDSRHDNAIKSYYGQIEKISFSDWLMGFRALTKKEVTYYANQMPKSLSEI